MPSGREGSGAEMIGERPREGSGDEEARGQGQHVDAGPQRRADEVVAVQRQPDPLEPDDQHEHQPTPADGGEEARQDTACEGADPEEREAEHGLGHPGLDHGEGGDEQDTRHQADEDDWTGPTHGVAPVGLDAVGDGDHHQHEAEGERDVARPVDPRSIAVAHLAELDVAPDSAEQSDRHRHQEDEPPVDGGEDAAEDQADERAADAGGLVDAESEATLIVGEGVGEDGSRVGDEEGSPDPLEDADDDQPQPCRSPVHPGDRQQQGEEGEEREPEVVHPHAAVHVAQATKAHDQDAGDHEEAEDHPQEVEAVARLERIEVDASEDVGQGDQHDRGVDRGHQHAQGRDRQGRPLVGTFACRARRPPRRA